MIYYKCIYNGLGNLTTTHYTLLCVFAYIVVFLSNNVGNGEPMTMSYECLVVSGSNKIQLVISNLYRSSCNIFLN